MGLVEILSSGFEILCSAAALKCLSVEYELSGEETMREVVISFPPRVGP